MIDARLLTIDGKGRIVVTDDPDGVLGAFVGVLAARDVELGEADLFLDGGLHASRVRDTGDLPAVLRDDARFDPARRELWRIERREPGLAAAEVVVDAAELDRLVGNARRMLEEPAEWPLGAELGGGRWRVTEVLRGGPDRGQLRADGEPQAIVTIAPPLRADRSAVTDRMSFLSPRIAPLLWVGAAVGEGVPYEVMLEEEPEGAPLDRWRPTPAATARVALDLAEVVRDAADRGLVLGGLRPELVWVADGRVSGVAPRAERFFSLASERSYGVPPCFDEIYLAPEQLAGRPPGPPADVFSLGATLARLLTGRAPFAGATMMDKIAAALRGKHGPLAAAGPRAPLIEAMLHVEPAERPPIEDVVAALR